MSPTAKDCIDNIRIQRGERTMSSALNLAARVEKVLELHVPGGIPELISPGPQYCKVCGTALPTKWPCPTVRLLNGEEP